jgi:molybdopterin-containing oxidoreductase family membrane subunit
MYPVGEYTPSIYEWLNLMGTTGLVALGLLVFVKTLPVVSFDRSSEVGSDT